MCISRDIHLKPPTKLFWLVVSTHLKHISQIGNLPQIGVKIFGKYLKPPTKPCLCRFNICFGITGLFLCARKTRTAPTDGLFDAGTSLASCLLVEFLLGEKAHYVRYLEDPNIDIYMYIVYIYLYIHKYRYI